MSMMSAPPAIIDLACATARSGMMNFPPSENESGVMFSTPITAGYGLDNSAGQARRFTETATGAALDEVAIMGSLCAVPAGESRRGKAQAAGAARPDLLRSAGRPRLIGNLGLKLSRLGDQLLDRLLGRGHADEFALDVHFFHILRQARRVAKGKFADRGNARGAHQAYLRPAHAGNPHVVRKVCPFEQKLLADAGFRRKHFAASYGPRRLKQSVRRANAQRFQLGSGEGR